MQEITLIKSKKEQINHKYDIREVFYLNIPEYINLRFIDYDSCFNFYCDLINNGVL